MFDNTTLIDNATINLGGSVSGFGGSITDLDTDNSGNKVLTFGSGLIINSNANDLPYSNDIGVGYYYDATDQAESVVNKGTINVLSGTLALASSTDAKTGTIAPKDFANQGTINVSSGAILQGGLSRNPAGAIGNSGGIIALGSDGGAAIGSGTTISGGTVTGVLTVNVGDLFLANSVTFNSSTGGNGTIVVGSNNFGTLVFDNTTLIDNATINLGGSVSGFGGSITDLDTNNSGNKVLTFGSGLIINSNANDLPYSNDIGVGYYYDATDQAESVVNKGTINVLSGTLALAGAAFTNESTITVSSGATLSMQAATAVNLDTISLVGGTLNIGVAGPSGRGRITGFGTINLGGPIANLVEASGGTLALTGTASGALQIGAGATLDAQASTGSVTFVGAGGTLVLHPASAVNQGAPLQLTVSGFTPSEKIDLAGVSVTKIVYQATGAAIGILSLYSGATSIGTITLAGNYAGAHFTTTPDGSGYGYAITVSQPSNDYNGDGKSDLVVTNDNGAIDVFTDNGLALSGFAGVGNPGPTWHVMGTGDFNGDGKPDILLQNDSGAIVDYLMNGTGVAAADLLGNPGSAWHVRGAGDFNGDGTSDLLLQNVNGAMVDYTLTNGAVTGAGYLGTLPAGWAVEGVADFDGNGTPDILAQNTGGSLVVFTTANGGAINGSTSLGNPGPGWSVGGTGDYNGDGTADILLHNDTGSDVVYLMSGGAFASAAYLGNPGAGYGETVAGLDLNGDGASDLVVQNRADGTLIGYTLNNAATITAGAVLTDPGLDLACGGEQPDLCPGRVAGRDADGNGWTGPVRRGAGGGWAAHDRGVRPKRWMRWR